MSAHYKKATRLRGIGETRWLLLIIVMSDMTNGGVQGPIEGYNTYEELTTTTATPPTTGYTHPKWMEPYFDPSTPRNVTALMGKSAYLSCRVRNLGNKTVSWIRHRDIHILTVGAYTYTSDQRFQATHHQDTDDWTLQIKWAQKRDAGMYECQISTQPVRSYFVRLNVVVPTATILGGPDLHVDKGSTINLTCTVKFSPEPPAYIFWYHHEEVINYDSSRGGVSVITEKGDVTTSFLLIQNADLADSGKYSCAPSNADVASVRVHVLNGEHPEAMQTGSSGCQYSWLTIFLLMCLVYCYNKQQQQLAFNATSNVHDGNSMLALTLTTTTATTIDTERTTRRRTVATRAISKHQIAAATTTTTTNCINANTITPTVATVVLMPMVISARQQERHISSAYKQQSKSITTKLTTATASREMATKLVIAHAPTSNNYGHSNRNSSSSASNTHSNSHSHGDSECNSNSNSTCKMLKNSSTTELSVAVGNCQWQCQSNDCRTASHNKSVCSR